MVEKLKFKNYAILFLTYGIIYLVIEVIYYVLQGNIGPKLGGSPWSLIGYTSLWMFPCGGLIGVVLGRFNEIKILREKANVFLQSLLGMCCILIVEIGSGAILNIWLGLHIWDHSAAPLNILGQTTVFYAFVWFALCPFIFWLDDLLKWTFYRKGNTYNLLSVYKDLLKFWKKTNYQK